MNAEEKKRNAVLADQVLENPVYAEAMTAIQGNLFNEWRNTKWFQVRKREHIWRMMAGAKAFEKCIEKRIRDGKQAHKY